MASDFPTLNNESLRKLTENGELVLLGKDKNLRRKLGGAVKKDTEGNPVEWKADMDFVYLTQPEFRVVGPRNVVEAYLRRLDADATQTGINNVIAGGVNAQNFMQRADVFRAEDARVKAAAQRTKEKRERGETKTKPKLSEDQVLMVLRGVAAKKIEEIKPSEEDKKKKKSTKRSGTSLLDKVTSAINENQARAAAGNPLRVVYNVTNLVTSGDSVGTGAKKDAKFNPDKAKSLLYVDGLPIVVNGTKSNALAQYKAALDMLVASGAEIQVDDYLRAAQARLGRSESVARMLSGAQ